MTKKFCDICGKEGTTISAQDKEFTDEIKGYASNFQRLGVNEMCDECRNNMKRMDMRKVLADYLLKQQASNKPEAAG